ncbi:AraC family transcriptional regulator [Veronia pacifica]|uniref:AraC family transcriptional regulator n=1 Tax=Veronia pacifica TaxID=1080227 RepID=A0A1C3ERM5_9GAMM|nr:AraC family transcriptional regulator [Veronia pacifica]ODA35893.1 AraC family transcriptional regulator [Veronia pacifica]
MKKNTEDNYLKRLYQVIDYIYSHIDESLDVNRLAEVACMSPYHFHRIYRSVIGEPVNATVRRLRLHKSAAMLLRSEHALLDVAVASGYRSSEAYNRAFKKEFGQTPGQFRVQGEEQNIPSVFSQRMMTSEESDHTMYDTELENFEGLKLVGIRHLGDYMNIGQVFEKLLMSAGQYQWFRQDTRMIGIYYDDPSSVPVEDRRSMACMTLPKGAEIPEGRGLEVLDVPAGKTVSLLFKGSYAELEKPYNWLFGEWLPSSGLEMENFPAFEEYLNDSRVTPPSELMTRIHCLVKPAVV